jgi:hypothetical protein
MKITAKASLSERASIRRSRIGRLALLLCIAKASAVAAQSIEGPIAGTPVISKGVLNEVPADYVAEEFFLSGSASSYTATAPIAPDGRWQVQAAASAPFITRLIVIRPAKPRRFNGTVVVEWLNVSGGADQSAAWIYLHRELIRQGYAFVGASVQRAGIEGGAADVAAMKSYLARQNAAPKTDGAAAAPLQRAFEGKQLKAADPQRYSKLNHPGDAFSYDMFTQVARAIRAGGLLGRLPAKTLLATGASQSASYLVTYINAIDPLAQAFDGYLVQARKKTAAPIDGDVFAALRSGTGPFALDHIQIREDARVPVLTYITEQDLMAPALGYIAARQPNSSRIRTWEVAGTAHGDIYGMEVGAIDTGSAPIEDIANAYASSDKLGGQVLARRINAAPQSHYVLQAGLASLRAWVLDGKLPPVAPVLQTRAAPAISLALDERGNARGGVRSPWMDVPTAVFSGLGDPSNLPLSMMGLTQPFDQERLSRLYPGGKPEYLHRFNTALDSAISGGFILAADRREIMALAAAMWPAR